MKHVVGSAYEVSSQHPFRPLQRQCIPGRNHEHHHCGLDSAPAGHDTVIVDHQDSSTPFPTHDSGLDQWQAGDLQHAKSTGRGAYGSD